MWIIGFVGGQAAKVSIRRIIGSKIPMEGIVAGSRVMLDANLAAMKWLNIRPAIAG